MKWPKLNYITIFAIVALFLMGAAALAGTIPNTLNYQGTLTDSTGKAVSAPAKPVTFKLYTSALGGAAFWSELQTVPVTNGQFSVVLGSTSTNALPTEKFTGNTFVGVTVENGPEMLPRQKMTSVAYALKAADAIPKGVIVMWSGVVGQIPEGWALCDGNNATPNLRDKFIIGAGSTYAIGSTGGEVSHVLTQSEMPSHTHVQDTHTHTQNSHNHIDAGHQHTSTSSGFQALAPVPQPGGGYSRSSGTGFVADVGNGNANIQYNTATNQYTTATNQNTGGGAAHNNLPPYYALAFIMKL